MAETFRSKFRNPQLPNNRVLILFHNSLLSPKRLIVLLLDLTNSISIVSGVVNQAQKFKLKNPNKTTLTLDLQIIKTSFRQIFSIWINNKIISSQKNLKKASLTYVIILLMIVSAENFSTNTYSYNNNYADLKKPS